MKKLALSLLLVTGTSLATNTGDVLDPNPVDGFLDGVPYVYPNIHAHSYNDSILWTGNGKFDINANELVMVSDYVSDTEIATGINWSVDYNTAGESTIYAGLVLLDANSNSLDNTITGYEVAGSGSTYVTISGVYNNEEILPDVEFIYFTIGGVSDRGYGDDIRLMNASLSLDYQDKVADDILTEIINDIIDNGGDVIKIEETPIQEMMIVEVEEAQEEIAEEIAEIAEVAEVVAEVAVEVKEEAKTEVVAEVKVVSKPVVKVKTIVKTVAKKTVKKQVKKVAKKTTKKVVKQTKTVSTKLNQALPNLPTVTTSTTETLKTLKLIKAINTMNQVAMADIIDMSSYTNITLSEAVELEDNEDWYQNQSFYSSIGMTDSGILNGYKNIKIKENGEWYGSNNQFY